ncbi:MAG TPA: TRAP transporter small permease [Firmicutes bacterium]|nr:TRAP transporter small permease [Bacillota bacterium]
MKQLDALLAKFEELFCSLGFIAATLLMFINVVMRYVFKAGIPWSEELIRYIIIWATCIGIGLCARREAHVSIDFFAAFLSKRGQKYLNLFADLVAVAFCGLMAYYSLQTVKGQLATGQLSPALQWPFYVVYFCLPLGFATGALRFVQHFYRTLKEEGEE